MCPGAIRANKNTVILLILIKGHVNIASQFLFFHMLQLYLLYWPQQIISTLI